MAIVREAGLRHDPDEERTLESNRLRMEAFKIQVTAGIGALIATGGAGFLSPAPDARVFLLAAVVCILVSLIMTFSLMHSLATNARLSDFDSKFGGLSLILLGLGLTSLILFFGFSV